MHLKYLETFIKIVDMRGFTEVSETTGMTQSGVSRQMKALEEEIGVQLLKRSPSAVTPTAAGDLVYRTAKRLLGDWDRLLAECQSLQDERTGTLKIGASTIPACYLLPQVVKSFREKYPKIEFRIHTGDSEDMLLLLKNRQVDLAFIGLKTDQEQFHADYVAADRLVLIGQQTSERLASLQEVAGIPLIFREKGSGTRRAAEELLRKAGIGQEALKIAAEVSSTEAAMALVEAGVGCSFVSHWSVREQHHPNLNILLELPTERGFYFYTPESRQHHPLLRLFIEEAQSHFRI